jgi:biopolymer transport protein ExbB
MPHKFTLWQAIQTGGPVMYFLIVLSIFSIGVMIERVLFYRKRSRFSRVKFLESIKSDLAKGDIKKASALCQSTSTPFAAVTLAGLNAAHLDEKDIAETMEREIVIQSTELERLTPIIGTIGSTAVYIGLLGTVWGIIKTFQSIAQAGSSGINVVIGGISEALVCTAAGLFVAIPAVAAYNYFLRRINGFVVDMELTASETAGLLKPSKKDKSK